MRRRFRLASWAFTLTELVIAISIIALLVAMLLPVINKSRRAAQAVVCLANLRTLGQAMRTYATENHDYLPGSPSTTARHLWNVDGAGQYQLQPGISRSNVPSPAIELFDYLGPLAQTMRIALPETDDGTARFRAYRNLPQFSCPANATTAMPESGETIEAGPMLSYVTGVCFMLLPWTDFYNNTSYEDRVTLPTGGGSPTPGTGNYWLAPAGYVPKLRKVGPAQGKIFLADAARRMRFSTPPQFYYTPNAEQKDSLFSDYGAFCGITRSYDRSVPNGMNAPAIDARPFSFRHGATSAGKRTGSYRLNVVYFDGHAEQLDDLTAANPALWMPTGSTIYKPNQRFNATDYVFWPDVAAKYLVGVSQSNPYVVP